MAFEKLSFLLFRGFVSALNLLVLVVIGLLVVIVLLDSLEINLEV